MNFKLDYTGYEKFMIDDVPDSYLGGAHYIFKFDNGFGASVIKHIGSYGYSKDLWELAVIHFNNEEDNNSWDLCYTTGVTENNDVAGYLTDEEVRDLLGRIQSL